MEVESNGAQLQSLLRLNAGHLHLVGICGIGMAGLAVLLAKRGFRVTGCDAALNSLADWLRVRGIDVKAGHGPAHLDSDLVGIIRSAAVPETTPELLAATARRLPVFRRGEVLPALLEGYFSIAVAGTHGKTTTTAFITQLLRAGGHDPAFCIGGEVSALGGVAAAGRSGILVVEADESDGTLVHYAPDIAVVTNIEFDHMEHFADVQAFENCFQTFIGRARQRVVYGADDLRAVRLCGSAPHRRGFGLGEQSEVKAVRVNLGQTGSKFILVRNGKEEGELQVSAPGAHNVLNALAATTVALDYGVSFEDIRKGLAAVQLPHRRFEKVVDRREVTVISDYAHHPSEVAAFVRAAHRLNFRRCRAIFQPHRYTRTLALGANFPPAFQGLDEVVLAPR